MAEVREFEDEWMRREDKGQQCNKIYDDFIVRMVRRLGRGEGEDMVGDAVV